MSGMTRGHEKGVQMRGLAAVYAPMGKVIKDLYVVDVLVVHEGLLHSLVRSTGRSFTTTLPFLITLEEPVQQVDGDGLSAELMALDGTVIREIKDVVNCHCVGQIIILEEGCGRAWATTLPFIME